MLTAAADFSMFDDFARFMASLAPEKVLAFQPSARQQTRLSELLAFKQTRSLTADEQAELDYFFSIERILRLAKAEALSLLVYEPIHS